MRRFLLSLLAVFMVTLSVRSEATVVLSEGFENGIPSTWTDTVLSYTTISGVDYIFHWAAETNSTYAPTGATEGDYRAAIRNTNSRSRTCVTRLITPVMDCSASAVWQPRLIFAHAQPMKSKVANQDSLKVYYRTSATSGWMLLKAYTERIDLWEYDTVDLISPTNTYQIAFEANISSGYGIVLDDISISAAPQCMEVQTVGVVAMSNSAEVTIGADLSTESFQVVVTNAPVTDPDNVDTTTVVYYNPLLLDFNVVVPNLQPQTDYYVYVRSACADMASGYTAWVGKAFRTSVGFPMSEEFTNGVPTDWSRKQGKLEDVYGGQALRDYTSTSYGWKKSTNTTLTGSTHVYCHTYNYASSSTPQNYEPYWLVSPGIDLVNVPNDTAIELTFNVRLTNSATDAGAIGNSGLNDLQYTVLVSEDNGETWNAGNATVWSTSTLATYPISQINNTLKHVRVNMNRYKGEVVRLAFVGQTASTTAYFHLDDVSIHSYDAQCGDVLKVTANPAVNSITANWTISGKENATVEISTVEDFATVVESAPITTGTSYTFTNLTQNTMYYIRVKQDCEGAVWVNTSCRTAVGLPYLNPFTGTTMPQDWTRYTGVELQDVLNGQGLSAAVTSGWNYSSTYTSSYSGMTDGCVYASLSSTNKYWLVSPTIMIDQASNDPLRLSFLLAAAKSASAATAPDFSDTDDVFAVLISEDAGRTWTQANATIWDCDTLTTNQKLNTFSEVPQRISVDMANYRGKAVKIALYSGSTVAGATNYILISNLSVNTYDASCGGVRNLGVNVTSTSATVNWTAVGNPAVNVQLSTNSNFTELVDSLSTSGSTTVFNALLPHTHYYVRVRQTCSTDDVDWATGSFTTPYGVPFTEMFTGSVVPSDWVRCYAPVDSVLAGRQPLSTSTTNQRVWTKGSSLPSMYLNMYGTSTYSCNGWFITPNLDMTGAGQNAQLNFNLAVSGSSTSLTTATTTAKENTFMVLGSTDDGATWFVLRDWRNDGASAERFSDIPNKMTRMVVNLSQYTSGNLRLAFYGGTTSGSSSLYVHINKVQVKAYDANCQGIASLRVTNVTSDGATVEWVAGGAQSAEVLVATDTSFVQPVYNQTVSGNATITNLTANTMYYVKARQSCDTEGEWMFAEFKTLCSAVTPADFGMESFDDESKMDCWTVDYMDAGTASSTKSGRASVSGFGYVLRLAKSSANTSSTTYADRPYAVSPEMDVDSINKYQVTFDACTNNTGATNKACLYVGIATDPNDMGSIEHVKTLNLSYASDSTKMNTYVVSFADYEGDLDGNFGRYIVFSAAPAPDSTNYVLIDNVIVSSADGCQQLIETSMDSIMATTAHFTWENSGATQYEVIVSLYGGRADTIPDSSLVFHGTTQTNSITIDSLEGNTRYYAYVRGICVDDNSETTYSRWSSAYTFKTLCTFISQYPWMETFENMTANAVPDCWDNSGSTSTTAGGTNSYYVWGVYNISQNKSLRMYNYYVSSGTALINTPAMVLPASSIYQLTFDYSNRANCGDLLVKISEDFGVTFTEIGSYSATASTDKENPGEFASDEISLAAYAGKTVIIQFFANANYGSGAIFVDNIGISEAPSCVKPATVEITNPTEDGATLRWTAGGNETNFEYVVVASGDSVNWNNAVATSQLTATLTGLNANTLYDVYVRANCGATDQSEPRMVSFRTACGLTALPFAENFESWESGLPACWEKVGSGTVAVQTTHVHAGNNSLKFSGATSNVVAFPLFNAEINTLQLTIYTTPESYTNASCGSFDVGYLTDVNNDTTFQAIETWTYSDFTAYEEKVVMLTSAPAGARLAFRHRPTSTSWYWFVDDIVVEPVTSCVKPITVEVSDPTSDGAIVTWTADSAATSFEYVVVASGASANWSDSVATSQLTVTLNGLNANTSYDFYVRSVCSATEKSGPRLVTFRTACGQTGVPFSEDFESWASGIPTCWEKVGSGTVAVQTTNPHSGTKSLKFSGASSNVIAFPEFSGEINTLQLAFYTRPESFTNSSCGSFDVGYLTDVNDATSFNTIDTWSYDEFTEYEEKVVMLSSAPSGARLAFRHRPTSTAWYWFVDDIVIETIPDCPKPKNVAVSSLMQDQATITWNSESTIFTMQYGTDATFADSSYTEVIVHTNSKVLTGLTPQTAYYVRVQADCETSGLSEWSEVLRFSTTAIPTLVGDSWNETFEAASCTWELINGPSVNQWVWGTAAHNGGTHSLYISDDNGANNTYTVSSAAMNYAVKLLNFEAGKYEFSYDWQAYGESTYDYLRVALVPGSVTLSAGTTLPSGFNTTSLPAGWIALDGGSKLNLSNEWSNKTVAVTLPSGNYYLVLAWRDDTSSGTNPPAAVDNVNISRIACGYDADSVRVSNITVDSATVTWKNSGATQWQISYSAQSSFENATDSIINDTTFYLSGLNPATIYYVKVRAYCGGTEFGSWSNTVTFITDCPAVFMLPFSQDFNGLTSGSIPVCWSNSEGTTTTASYRWSAFSNTDNPFCMRFNSYYNTSGYTNILATPSIMLSTPARLSFRAKNPSGGDYTVMLQRADGTRVTLLSNLTNIADWTNMQVNLTNYIGQKVQILFKGTSNYHTTSADDPYLYLDDVEIVSTGSSTQSLFGVTVGALTHKSVELMLAVNPDTTVCHNFELVVSTTALTDSVLDTIAKTQLGDVMSYTVTGLKREKTYYFYVRSACDSVVGQWYSASATTKGLVDCAENWTGGESTATSSYLPTYSFYNYTVTQQIFTPAEIGMAGDISAITFNSTGSTITRDIDVYLAYTSKSAFATTTDWDPADGAVLVYSGSVDFNTDELITLTFSSPFRYDGVSNLLLMVDDNTGTYTSGLSCSSYTASDYQALYKYNDTDNYNPFEMSSIAGTRTMTKNKVRFDICYQISPCPEVTNLSATVVGRGTSTFDLSWTASTAENLIDYDVYVGTVDPATMDSVPETYRQLTDTMLSLTALTPATHYYAAVRANCNEDDGVSTWAIVEFTTYATCPMVENLTAQQVSKTEVIATWEFGGPELDTVFNYVLSTTDSVDWTTVVPDTVNALTLDLVGLLPSQQYWLYVAQNCATENSEYAVTTFTMPAECAPIEDLTYDVTHSTVTLTWSSAAFGTETAWEAGLVNGPTQIVTERKAIFFGLSAETNYTAYVRAICSDTDMSDPDSISFRTTPDPEPCVEIGDGTSVAYIAPFDNFYKNGVVQTIYTADQIGQAGSIESIQYNCSTTASEPLVMSEVYIYMGHTTMDVATTTTSWLPQAEATLVYSASNFTLPSQDGPFTITLQTPFAYNGTDNLVIIFRHKGTDYESGIKFFYTAGTSGVTLYAHSDTDQSYGDYPSASLTGTKSTNQPNVTFCFPVEGNDCNRPTKLAVSDITARTATVSWMPGGHEVEWNTVLSAVALGDSALAAADMDTVRTLSQSFTGLNDDTDYHFYIRSSCDSATVSGWQEIVFTTTAMCLIPVNLSVDSVTSTSAYLSWGDINEGYDAATYQVAYGLTANFDLTIPSTYQVVPTTDTALVLNGLSSNTLYSYAVSIICDATYTSRWSTPVQARTGCGVVTMFPWTEDFEPYSTGTLNIPCWSNEHIAGSGSYRFQITGSTISGNETKKLYLPDMSAGTKTQLTLPEMYIDEANEYEFDIDVLRNATSYATEGLRIYVSTDDSLANATELAFISRNYSVADSVHGIPAESESGWYTYELNIPMSDTLYIIIVGESQYGAATYADNFRVRRQPTCKRPVIVMTEATDNSIQLTWTGGDDREYRVECDTLSNFSTKRTLTVTADTTVTVSGLTPATQYWFRVKGICGDTAVSDYSAAVSAKTLYVLPFSENFSSSSIPADWSRQQGDVAGATEATSSGWYFTSSSSNYFAYSSVSSSSTTNARYTLVTPGIVMNTAESGVQLSFDLSLAISSTGTSAPDATVCAGREFSVVVSTDKGATWTKVRTWVDSSYTAIPVSARNYKIDLTNYVGQTVKVGFYHSVGTSTSTSTSYIRLDNVRINGYDNSCAGIDNLEVTNPGTVGTVVTWEYIGQGAPDAVIVVSTEATPDSAIVWSDTVRNATTVTLPTMPMSSTIHVFVKQICGEGESAWAEAMFKTPIGVPYHPVFVSTTFPTDWSRSTTSADNVFGGSTMTSASSGWTVVAGNDYMDGYHFKNNVYGTTKHDWLISPAIDMTPNVGQGIVLSFDLMLCDYSHPGDAPESQASDDLFMVVISDDGGATWKRQNATLWQDVAGADYSYFGLPYDHVATYRIDLSSYTGKVIKIGFYVESTVYDPDNDLHMGNIYVEQVSANMYNDTICEGESYQNYGFTITADQYQVGTNTFSSYTPATTSTPALLDVLTLEVLPITDTTINVTLCEGAAYVYDENVYVEEGEVEAGDQTITFFLTSKYGCDSIVNLHITGLPSSRMTEYAETCSGIPYNWHGQDYYLTGTYVDTLQTILGCDSICTLLLTVQERLHSDTAVTLCYGEQIIINGQTITTSGIYTEFIDNPEGCDEEVAWHVTAIGKLESHKRVVVCKGETYSDDLIQGLTQEYHGSTTTTSKVSGCDSTVIYDIWFAEAGETLYVNVPQNELPFYVNGLELVAAGTAEGEYTRTVATNCGDIVMVISVGKPVERYTITVKGENGLPYGSGIYVAGEQVEIGVTPLNGYKFDKWNDGNTENPRTITVTADATYTGTCVAIQEGLEDVIREMGEDEVLKLIENQQLIIIRNGVRYNAQGAVME